MLGEGVDGNRSVPMVSRGNLCRGNLCRGNLCGVNSSNSIARFGSIRCKSGHGEPSLGTGGE